MSKVKQATTPAESILIPDGIDTETLDIITRSGVSRVVELTKLFIDQEHYQRHVKPHSKIIARNFDAMAAGELLINERPDGVLALIDGQQRLTAMLSLGITHWTARVVHLKTIQQESALFSRVNGGEKSTRPLTQRELFKSRLSAGDRHALLCVHSCENNGLRVSSGNQEWPNVTCLGTLYWLASHNEEGVLEQALNLLSQAWKGNSLALADFMIRAACSMVKLEGYRHDHAINRLGQVSVSVIHDHAISNKGMVSTVKGVFALEKMVSIYNKRLKSSKLTVPEERVRGSRAKQQMLLGDAPTEQEGKE